MDNKIPDKRDQHKLKGRFQISNDELQFRMDLQSKYHDKPCSDAALLMGEARDMMMGRLGIDVTQDDETIHRQQDDLGITIWEEDREEMAGIQGMFIHINYDELTPYAWVGTPYVASDGLVYVDIHDFIHETKIVFGGIKISLEGQ